MVYCADVKNWIPTEIEIQILDDFSPEAAKYPKSWLCGAIFGRLAPTKSTVKKPGEWNHMTIVCNGQHISVTLNGETITKMDMSKWTSATKNPDGSVVPEWINKKPLAELPTKGHVGLQGKTRACRLISATSRSNGIDAGKWWCAFLGRGASTLPRISLHHVQRYGLILGSQRVTRHQHRGY